MRTKTIRCPRRANFPMNNRHPWKLGKARVALPSRRRDSISSRKGGKLEQYRSQRADQGPSAFVKPIDHSPPSGTGAKHLSMPLSSISSISPVCLPINRPTFASSESSLRFDRFATRTRSGRRLFGRSFGKSIRGNNRPPACLSPLR